MSGRRALASDYLSMISQGIKRKMYRMDAWQLAISDASGSAEVVETLQGHQKYI